MKWVLWPVAAVIAIGVVVTLIGWMLPAEHEASRSAAVARPPEEVYLRVADVAGYPGWFEGVSRIEMLPATEGRTRFRQHTGSGTLVMEIVEALPPSRFVTRITDPGQPFGGTWTFDIAPEGAGSRVTITERGEVYNPLFRFMARFVFGYTGTMDACLRSLERAMR